MSSLSSLLTSSYSTASSPDPSAQGLQGRVQRALAKEQALATGASDVAGTTITLSKKGLGALEAVGNGVVGVAEDVVSGAADVASWPLSMAKDVAQGVVGAVEDVADAGWGLVSGTVESVASVGQGVLNVVSLGALGGGKSSG